MVFNSSSLLADATISTWTLLSMEGPNATSRGFKQCHQWFEPILTISGNIFFMPTRVTSVASRPENRTWYLWSQSCWTPKSGKSAGGSSENWHFLIGACVWTCSEISLHTHLAIATSGSRRSCGLTSCAWACWDTSGASGGWAASGGCNLYLKNGENTLLTVFYALSQSAWLRKQALPPRDNSHQQPLESQQADLLRAPSQIQ